MIKIDLNPFVLRQIKDDFVGTKITLEEIHRYVAITQAIFQTSQLQQECVKEGYAPFCKLVTIINSSLFTPIIKITPDNEHLLVTQYRGGITLPYP